MSASEPVTAIFDVGKTNKKFFLFDANYNIIWQKNVVFPEISDDEGFPCENIASIVSFINQSLNEVIESQQFNIRMINFSAYGASLMYVGNDHQPIAPLYNYLKPYPDTLLHQFYGRYGGQDQFCLETASPALGSLNAGLQLYRLKIERPEIFKKVKYALHLPQFLSALLSHKNVSEMTSIGCHTGLWDFAMNHYHQWIFKEKIYEKLPPISHPGFLHQIKINGKIIAVGTGLHDSSAALIPYTMIEKAPFVIISTGTWNISMNPFNNSPLTLEELQNDCLFYLTNDGEKVKASRLFTGRPHEEAVLQLTDFFHISNDYYKQVRFNLSWFINFSSKDKTSRQPEIKAVSFSKEILLQFTTFDEAYHYVIYQLVKCQVHSTQLVIGEIVPQKIFIDGGFSNNEVFMNMIALSFPFVKVFAAKVAQASSLGAALALHGHSGFGELPSDLIKLKYYQPAKNHLGLQKIINH